jgi:tagatose-6-phosphate ketose/aldose isomerase
MRPKYTHLAAFSILLFSFTFLWFPVIFPTGKRGKVFPETMPSITLVEPDWLRSLSERQPVLADLLSRTTDEQRRLGYFHTIREICQQPLTWLQTSAVMGNHTDRITSALSGVQSITLTGSGSSEYAADCVRLPLQNELGVTTQAIGGGTFLTQGKSAFPFGRPGLMVSLARSGDSPESAGALGLILKADPAVRQLVLTCNEQGLLAQEYRDDPRVLVITLPPETNDRGLVMTSSFTNLVLAARCLGMVSDFCSYQKLCEVLSRLASAFYSAHFGKLAEVGTGTFHRAVFLGSGSRFAAAREAALKMLEMTAGRVATLSETFLGLRHGPMSYVDRNTLIVCFHSSHPLLRAYEADLMCELDHKRLGIQKVVVGESIPDELLREGDVGLECEGLSQLGDENACVIDVVAAQLLAFFRCMAEGLKPDSPSDSGVISRVVQKFTLHPTDD